MTEYTDTITFWLAVRDWCYRQLATNAVAVPFLVELNVPESTVRVREADPSKGLFTLSQAAKFCEAFADMFGGERDGSYLNGMAYNVCLTHRAPVVKTMLYSVAAYHAGLLWTCTGVSVSTMSTGATSGTRIVFSAYPCSLTTDQVDRISCYVAGEAASVQEVFAYGSPYWVKADQDAHSVSYMYVVEVPFVDSVRMLVEEICRLGLSVTCEDMRGGVGMLTKEMLTPEKHTQIFSILLKGLKMPFYVEERLKGVFVLPTDPQDTSGAACEDTWGY